MPKGLTIQQYNSILEFVQKYHKFANYDEDLQKEIQEKYPKLPKTGLSIKYIDSIYDSRDGTIWSISFRRGSLDKTFQLNSGSGNLYDRINHYLTTGEYLE